MNERAARPRLLRYLALILVAGMLCLAAVSWYMGGKLAAPANHPIGPPPISLAASPVTFPSESGSTIHGWLLPGTPGRGAVLVLHGVRSDRRSMIGRAGFLHALGYSVLLIDLQAHGESQGEHITLGHLESRDVIAAREYLRKTLPAERVAAIGVSLGAASITLANGQAQFESLGAPLLLIHGTEDRHTLIDEARSIFARAAAPKQFWEVPGAAHVDLHRFATVEYERRVGEFIGTHLAMGDAE